MTAIEFFKEGLKNVWTVGTFIRSSKALSKRIIRNIDFKEARCIVELGAGDGAITKYLLQALPDNCRLMVFELNSKFTERLRELKDDRLIVIEDTAEKLEFYLKEHGFEKADTIVSTLPLIMFPEDEAMKLIRHSKSQLKEGSKYIQVHYSLLAKKLHKKVFDNVSIQFEFLNIPPVYLHICS